MSDGALSHILYPVMMLIVYLPIVLLGVGKEFRRLQGHFQGSDAALRRALYLKGLLPSLGMGIAFTGLAVAQELNGSIWSWVVGFTCLFVAAGVLSLFYVGPLRLLFAELEDADISAHKYTNSDKSHQGS
ncbi:hypothetical protein [Aquidulcibacter paucihalophilus]|uniref:hypothetical protein n=1 Tax=Aquidulcibacter paucihalophilus TaxID=1978549 RepID=UPI000A18EA9F|nr:hypothetical protein [Aquidulcibacter paucihalophilus]